MATREVKDRPRIEHRISSLGLTVDVTGEHDSSFVVPVERHACLWSGVGGQCQAFRTNPVMTDTPLS
jgi:hypothetical protein